MNHNNEGGWPIKELWSEYEKIAMHFNDLLIRLRTQALGGVAAISAVVGVFSKGGQSLSFPWEVGIGIFAALMGFWISIWIIDLCYYNRLLQGAVVAITEIEEASKTHSYSKIQLSTRIKDQVESGSRVKFNNDTIVLFYTIVFIVLISGLFYCVYKFNTT